MLPEGTSLTTELKCLDPSLNSNASLYSPLDQERSEFRLLELFPGEQQAPLRCSLRVEPFRTWNQERSQWMVKNYETISYCWGDPGIRELITVNDMNISVPRSSAAALRCMRLETERRTLWIDAICIDQSNIDERSHQVRMMRRIYMNGLVNLVYLGATDMQDASDSIKAICDNEQASNIVDEASKGGRSEFNCIKAAYNVGALVSLFENDWFKRVWVVQEAALAQRNQVHAGTTAMDLLDITRAATILAYNVRFIDAELSKLLEPVETMYILIDPDPEQGFRRNVPDPTWLAYMLRERNATEPVDKIYAMLGLLPEAEIIPDYSKEPAQVYLEATKWIVKATDSLNILRLAEQAVPNLPEFHDGHSRPSWAPDFGHQFEKERGQCDFCFWFNSTGERSFGASGNLEWRGSPDTRILPARGIRLGSICSQQCPGGQRYSSVPEIVTDWLVRMEYEPSPRSSLEEVLAMTLCAGATSAHGLVETNDAILGLRALQECFRRGIDPLNITELHERLGDSDETIDATQRAAGSYEEALEFALKARHLFLTRNGFCGLGPQFIHMEDVAVVLFGLRWPAILRPIGSRWHFLGLAYIHGAMNGEIIAQQQGAGGQVDEVFEII